MEGKDYLHLIMELGPGEYGRLGTVSDVSALGYGDLAEAYEEVTQMDSFYSITCGRISTDITIVEVLENGSFLCLLDDNVTKALISEEARERCLLFHDRLYPLYCERLEERLNITFPGNRGPDFDHEIFAVLVRESPVYCEPFQLAGYFEYPDDVEGSKRKLQGALDEAALSDADEVEEKE